MDRHALAAATRRGDVVAMRRLHGLGGPAVALDPAIAARWAEAGADWRDRLDPSRRPVPSGAIDFHRLHCLALDQFDGFLGTWLPQGERVDTDAGWFAWRGARPGWPNKVDVCLFRGCWDEPATGRGGPDLVALVAHLGRTGMRVAAADLARWLGVGVRRAS